MDARGAERRTFSILVAIVAAVTLLRIVALWLSPLELYPDEAQYWWWAQTPDIGYFSKPPLIAWIIGATTALFGDHEWAIRLAMPLLHAAASLLLYGIARETYPKATMIAFWSALAYLTVPGVSYSATLASTDAPLLFFWALALFAFLKAEQSADWRWPLLCGAALGLGVLSKYAMLFFLIGVALACLMSPRARKFVLSGRGFVAGLAALAIVAPNMMWNVSHDFATLAHIRANAAWTRASFSPLHLLGFVAGQFGVFGPVLMAAWLAALWRIARARRQAEAGEIVLCAFSAPSLVLITVQSFVVDANANWAATAYVAAVPLAVAEILAHWPRIWLWISFALHGALLLLLTVILVVPSAAEHLGVANVFKRETGWSMLAGAVSAEAARGDYTAIASDNRSVTAELLYYLGPRGRSVRIWDPDTTNHNHFEMTMRLTPPAPRVLLVVRPEDAIQVLSTFDSNRLLSRVVEQVGGHRPRVMLLYDARDYRGPQNLN
jgi:4-amino-4-deoxy-L-arabinose transferase-like glycosyltransferase